MRDVEGPGRSTAPNDPWSAPGTSLSLDASQVHVWKVELAPLEGDVARLRLLLEEGERARADRFRFPRHAARFVVCRAAQRTLLGKYLGRSPKRVRFRYSPLGKPSVDDPAVSALQFNLSHSEDLALIAVASGRHVGVDVERIREDRATHEIASRFFSSEEAAALRELPSERRGEAFFACWTRKEAYLKARGDGLSLPLDSFSVSVDPGQPAALLGSAEGEREVARWTLRDLAPPAGYAAALAAEGGGWQLVRWRCPPDLILQR